MINYCFVFFLILSFCIGCKSWPEANNHKTESLSNEGFGPDFLKIRGPIIEEIKKKINDSDLDQRIIYSKLSINSPLPGNSQYISNRFSTPQIFDHLNYMHGGIDFTPEFKQPNMTVVAPVNGLMFVLYGYPIIYDQESHAVIVLAHVKPYEQFLNTISNEFINVSRNQAIGTTDLAPPLTHVHLDIYDTDKNEVLNALLYFKIYQDQVKPQILNAYFRDHSGKRSAPKPHNNMDLIVVTYDEDNRIKYHFEVSSLSYRIINNNNEILFQLYPCNLEKALSTVLVREEGTTPTYNLMDLAAVKEQLEAYDVFESISIPEDIHFPYVLTNLKSDSSGDCQIIDDKEGYIRFDTKEDIKVIITVSDFTGNKTTREFNFSL